MDADIDKTSTMVALMVPQEVASKIAVDGGVPAEDLHVTVTFHGDTDDATFKQLVADLQGWVKDAPIPLKLEGTLGGIGTFPPGEDGQPWWVPVDIPGLNTLHEQVRAVADRSAPASSDHGYSPHMTLTYTKDGEAPPDVVDPVRVAFPSLWVVRGNQERIELPLRQTTGAESTQHATLGGSKGKVDLAEGTLNILDLAERAKSIDDPELRKKVMGQILDLAKLTKDGRKSFKSRPGQKWRHGFIPLNDKAVEAKAKGSPIARKRIERIFGKKTPGGSKRVTVEGEGGNKVTASSAARLRGAKAPDIQRSHRVKNSQFEKNKVGRVDPRATREWDNIPDEAKTVRNGKRYVVSTYKGEQVLTEWQGGVRVGETKNTTKYKTLTTADAKEMSTAELRKILKDSAAPKAAKQVAYKALQAKLKAGVKA